MRNAEGVEYCVLCRLKSQKLGGSEGRLCRELLISSFMGFYVFRHESTDGLYAPSPPPPS